MCLIYIFKFGMFWRIIVVVIRLFCSDGCGGSFYILDSLNLWVCFMIIIYLVLVLFWCQILLFVNYIDYCWWVEVQQILKRYSLFSIKLFSFQMFGEEEDFDLVVKFGMCNREIV